jgi:hypothetical protein
MQSPEQYRARAAQLRAQAAQETAAGTADACRVMAAVFDGMATRAEMELDASRAMIGSREIPSRF